MKNSQKAFAVIGVLLVCAASILAHSSSDATAPAATVVDARRSFYLTKAAFTGSQALTACASGYHMASAWEIKETTLLRYATRLGRTNGDSSAGGPPSVVTGDDIAALGWIRTGSGAPSCSKWTSSSSAENGTYAYLSFFSPFNDYGNGGVPCDIEGCEPKWVVGRTLACDGTAAASPVNPGVWCVQN